jgi:hypothetical protein
MREVIEQNRCAALITREEIRMLLGGDAEAFTHKKERRWRKNERRHFNENYPHANRRVGAKDRRA